MLICLTGMAGCGKSTIGRPLAQRLNVPLFDSDEIISERFDGRPPSEIFAVFGEEAFRDVEKQVVIQTIAEQEIGILSLGGGALDDHETAEAVFTRTHSIWIDVPEDILWQRIEPKLAERPMFQGDDPRAKLNGLIARRSPIYRRASHRLEVSDNDAMHAVDEIIKVLEKEA